MSLESQLPLTYSMIQDHEDALCRTQPADGHAGGRRTGVIVRYVKDAARTIGGPQLENVGINIYRNLGLD